MISSDVIRGYIDTMILYLLIQGDSYGYEIAKSISQITEEEYVIKETTLYSAFTRLEKNECVTSYSGMETKGKKRTYYHITEQGHHIYEQKCKEWVLTKKVIGKFIDEKNQEGEWLYGDN